MAKKRAVAAASPHAEGARQSLLSRELRATAKTMSDSTGEAEGPFIDLFKDIIAGFITWLRSQLGCINPVPLPVEPVVSTPQAKLAKENAWKIKGRAEADFDGVSSYKAGTLRAMANQIRRHKRRNGEPVSKDTALELAHQALDAAREKSLTEMTDLILEAQAEHDK